MTKLKLMALPLLVGVVLLGTAALPLRAGEKKPAPAAHEQQQAHPGDPVKQEEHTALFDLVNDCDSTHEAVADGAWDDPTTWNKKSVPGAGARVVIPKGRTVTVAARHDKDRLDWVRVDGTLRFDPKANTALKVVTLVGNVKSTIEIGTDKERIQPDKSARLILGDRGVRDEAQRKRDPYDLSGGLLAHGRVRVFGALTTGHATPTAVPKKGDTQVRFARAPRGWKVGDALLFPGLDRQRDSRDQGIDPWTGRDMPVGQHQDEVCTVKAIAADGRTITLERALAYQHGGIYGYAEAVPVGNLTRNVVVESENVRERSRRGHVMFMHTQDVIIDGALFRELGRTDAGTGHTLLTDPVVKNGKLVPGTDANTRGRYACHFHLRWGATYKQQPFIVRNSVVDGSPKFGFVNHGGYGLVDDNIAYRVKGTAFFTEVGNEIGRFHGNLAVRSIGDQAGSGNAGGGEDSKPSAPGKPVNFGAGGHGFWLQGGGVEVTDNFAIGNAFSAFFFSTSSETPVGKIQEPGYPATKGTAWEHWDAFAAENLKDPSLARGKPWIFASHVPFYMARCVGLASGQGLRNRGIMRVVIPLHEKLSLVEDCRFVWNETGSQLGYGVGFVHFRKTRFIGSDPQKGGIDSWGIGGINHIPGFIHLEEVTIDGYRKGYEVPLRGVNVIKGGFINGIRKVVVHHPWGGKLLIDGVKFGTMKGEEAQPIICTGHSDLLYSPEGDNWTRMFQPFEFVYNGRQVYQDVQKRTRVPFNPSNRSRYGARRTHGVLDGKTNQQLWDQYRLAIGGRLAPPDLTPCPDIRGGAFGRAVSFDPPVESEPTHRHVGADILAQESLTRWMFDPMHVLTHNQTKGYVVKVRIAGKNYRSEPTDLVNGVNVLPIKVGKRTRYVVLGGPTHLPSTKSARHGDDLHHR